MKLLTLFAAAVVLLFPGVAATQSTDTSVVVVAKPVTQAQWSRTITRKLDRALRSPVVFSNEIPPTGIVSVRFHAGDGGRPMAIEVARTSGTRRLDREAIAAIGRLRTLGPMPATFRPDQRFLANILFAKDQEQFDRQTALLRREAAARSVAARSAALGGSAAPIVLAVSSHAGVGSH